MTTATEVDTVHTPRLFVVKDTMRPLVAVALTEKPASVATRFGRLAKEIV